MDVYSLNGRTPSNYRLVDSSDLFSTRDRCVTLGQVRSVCRDEELSQIVQQEYAPELQRLASAGDSVKSHIAIEFLTAMGMPPRKELTPDQIREIGRAFHDWSYLLRNKRLSGLQERTLKSLGINHHYTGGDGQHSVVLDFEGKTRKLPTNQPADVIIRKIISFYNEFVK